MTVVATDRPGLCCHRARRPRHRRYRHRRHGPGTLTTTRVHAIAHAHAHARAPSRAHSLRHTHMRTVEAWRQSLWPGRTRPRPTSHPASHGPQRTRHEKSLARRNQRRELPRRAPTQTGWVAEGRGSGSRVLRDRHPSPPPHPCPRRRRRAISPWVRRAARLPPSCPRPPPPPAPPPLSLPPQPRGRRESGHGATAQLPAGAGVLSAARALLLTRAAG